MSLIRSAIRYGLRRGWTRGVVEGNRTWVVIGGVAVLGYLADRALHRQPYVVFREPLLPDESFLITHEGRS